MSRVDLQVKIEGPYAHKSGYRCRFVLPTGLRRWCPSAPTPEEARVYAEQVVALQEHEHCQTVDACIEAYVEHHREAGLRHCSLKNYRQALIRFFRPTLDLPLGRVTSQRAASLYEALRKTPSAETGKPYSVCTHRHALVTAKAFLGWCVKRRWLRVNPLAEVEGVGTKNRGKEQPTIDEARLLWKVSLREAAQGDDGALAVAIALSMALRSGEIISRTVRDLDDKGPDGLPRMLRIADNAGIEYQTKTRRSKRPLAIPEELQPMLAARARDKLPAALIFTSATGGKQWVVWVNRQVRRLCRAAGIPEFCAHALRGFAATSLAESGASPQVVAGMLGHSGPGVTMAHYIRPGTTEAVQQAQTLRVLKGGR